MEEKKKLTEEKSVLLEKGRQKALRLIFGRTALIVVLFLIQFGLMFSAVEFFSRYITAFLGGYMAFALLIVLIIINKEGWPETKLTWAIITLMLPVVGGLFYLFVEMQPGYRLLEKRLKGIYAQTEEYVKQDAAAMEALEQADQGTARLADYVRKNGNFSVYQNTRVKYFPLGEDKFEEMLRQLKQAEKFIFMEYFILREGYMWEKILEILEEKARAGVEVRVMYDGTCALFDLPYKYPEGLRKKGIQCKMYAPIQPILSTHYNNRDHRKILVVDGRVGFTGGINISDEYINRVEKHGHWKDTAVMLHGEAVANLTTMFLTMWCFAAKTIESFDAYMPHAHHPEAFPEAPGFVQPFGDSPLDNEPVSENVYRALIERAERYVYITTPYLILDNEITTALCTAARQGIDVRIITPHVADKWYVHAVTRANYPKLIESGVKIFEYTPGFIHAKMIVSDDDYALVGTINLDYRSLYLHFECGAWMYKTSCITQIRDDILKTQEQSQPITPEDYAHASFFTRLGHDLLRIFAPLM